MEFSTSLEAFVYQMLDLVTNELDREKLLSILAEKIATDFHTDACLIVTFLENSSLIKTGYWSKKHELLIPNICSFTLNITPSNQTISTNINIPNPMDIARENLAQEMEWCSMLSLHTYYHGQVNGFIALGYFDNHEWSATAKENLQKLGLLLSLVLAHQQTDQKQRKQAQYQTFLINLNREIERGAEISTLWRLSLTGLATCLKIDQAIILRLKYLDPFVIFPEQLKLLQAEVEPISHWSPEYPRKLTIKNFEIDTSPLCQKACFNSPQPLIITNLLDLQKINLNQKDVNLFRTNIFPCILILPILTTQIKSTGQEVILGFIVLQQREFRVWQNDEIKLVQAVATQLSMATIQRQSLRQIQSLVEERTSQLEWSLKMQRVLFVRTRQQVRELKRLNKVKDEFIDRLSDELKLPLTNMNMAITMLKLGNQDERSQRYLEILAAECNKEAQLINDLLTLQQIQKSKLEFNYEMIELKPLVEQVGENFQKNWQSRKLNLNIDYPQESNLRVYSDRDSLLRIFKELLKNSGKFSVPNSTVSLSIKKIFETEKPLILIELSNLGRGISKTKQNHIFEPFYRGEDLNNGSSQGAGLGLYIVRSLVEHLNGRIEVNSQVTEQESVFLTSFRITLPCLAEIPQF